MCCVPQVRGCFEEVFDTDIHLNTFEHTLTFQQRLRKGILSSGLPSKTKVDTGRFSKLFFVRSLLLH